MADYYTSLSFKLVLSPEQAEYALKLAGLVDYLAYWDGYEEEDPPEKDSMEYTALTIHDAGGAGTGCMWETTTRDDGAVELWIHGEENANPCNVADVIQYMLVKFNLDGAVVFEYANTCSKPRLDAYSGGAYIITQEDVIGRHTSTWIREEISALGLEVLPDYQLVGFGPR